MFWTFSLELSQQDHLRPELLHLMLDPCHRTCSSLQGLECHCSQEVRGDQNIMRVKEQPSWSSEPQNPSKQMNLQQCPPFYSILNFRLWKFTPCVFWIFVDKLSLPMCRKPGKRLILPVSDSFTSALEESWESPCDLYTEITMFIKDKNLKT